jgi:hypothetical protein
MSDDENKQLANTLLSTDDPMVWAQEFVRIFDGYMIGDKVQYKHLSWVDTATMVAWFANAMQTAIDMTKARQARIAAATADIPEKDKEAFIAGFDDGRDRPTDIDDPTA